MPLVFTLAFRNLFHDRLRFIATVIGIVFSIVLVTVQMGLYLGFGQMVTTMIDHASADLWIMPKGTKCFEDPSLLDTRQRSRALAVPGVAEAIPVVIGFADWRTPSGSSTPVFVVGSDLRSGGLEPWNLVEGRIESLSTPERGRRRPHLFRPARHFRAGRARRNPPAERAGRGGHQRHPLVHHDALCVHGRRPGAGPHRRAVEQGHLFPGARRARAPMSQQVRRDLLASLTDVEVLTPAEFRERSRAFWLFGTGAGAALFAGALLGVIVGTVIVAQTLYSSTKDHLNEFATLRAIGSSAQLHLQGHHLPGAAERRDRVWPRLRSSALLVVRMTAASALPIVITPGLTVALFVLTVVMCVVSAIAAIMKVTRIDPAMVFTR